MNAKLEDAMSRIEMGEGTRSDARKVERFGSNDDLNEALNYTHEALEDAGLPESLGELDEYIERLQAYRILLAAATHRDAELVIE